MAFLDNSGDIILDAVLTDAGRQRLARGNFKITKFALGDEEMNYRAFNGSHPSGSAFYDLELMQTPLLEAFTNNTSLMKSKLITMTRNNILYMPVLKINNRGGNNTRMATFGSTTDLNFNGFIVLADKRTEQNGTGENFNLRDGLIRGAGDGLRSGDLFRALTIDQGIESTEGGLSFRQRIPGDLVETAYLVKMDHRLLEMHRLTRADRRRFSKLPNQFVDDDGIATYYVVQGDGTNCVEGAPNNVPSFYEEEHRDRANVLNENPDDATSTKTFDKLGEMFPGPLGSILRFYPRTSAHVRNSDALFNELGTTVASGADLRIEGNQNVAAGDQTITSYKYIDTLINVVGVTTGYSIDVPIRIVKKS